MYQGKYERKDAPPTQPKPAPRPAPQTEAPSDSHPVPQRRSNPQGKSGAQSRPAEKPTSQSKPASQSKPNPQRRASAKKRKRPPTKGTLIFYGCYVGLILVFFIVMAVAMGALHDWLLRFEASQPDSMGQELFNEYFSDPDWGELYTLAGIEDTPFEGKDAYAAYMDSTVGDTALTYVKTSGGLSGQKYIVRAGDEKIATYTIVSEDENTSIPQWELGKVELFFEREQDCTIIVDPGCTVTVNGVTLNETYTLRSVTTAAEKYLPEGIHGYRLAELYVDDLLNTPTVAATDSTGSTVELTYDADTRTYSQTITPPAITDSEYDALVNAAKTYCRFMIGANGESDLKKCFDSDSEVYRTIIENDTWMQSYKGYDFGKATVTDFYRYSDTLMSARVVLVLNVTRKNGTVKQYDLNNTFLMELQNGTWKVIEMTNVNIQEQTTMVRLTYWNGDAMVSTEMVDAATNKLTPPAVTVPEGQVFSGWFTETIGEDGNMTMSLAFLPKENGTVSLPDDSILEPMTLYALFE